MGKCMIGCSSVQCCGYRSVSLQVSSLGIGMAWKLSMHTFCLELGWIFSPCETRRSGAGPSSSSKMLVSSLFMILMSARPLMMASMEKMTYAHPYFSSHFLVAGTI